MVSGVNVGAQMISTNPGVPVFCLIIVYLNRLKKKLVNIQVLVVYASSQSRKSELKFFLVLASF